MRVRELMTADVLVTTSSADLSEALRVLRDKRFRSLPVVDDGAVVGLLTEANAAALGDGRVADALSGAFVSARPDEMVADVLNRCTWAMQEAVLVLDAGRLVGILTESDACRHAAAVLDPELRVEDHANTTLVCVDREKPAHEALDRLRRNFLHDLVVLEDRVLYGMLSLRELVSARADQDHALTCGALVRVADHPTVCWDTPLQVAAAAMVTHDVGCVPVLSDDGQRRVEAVISRGDVIRALLASGEVGSGDLSIEDAPL